jgi:PhoPQ-activated pathogenicity-related protein
MVIDMLNLPAQMKQQKLTYGEGLSPQVEPYTSRGVLDDLDTESGKKLLALVDPYAYRHLFTMPKLLLLGTNDPYWTVNAANIYFDELPGETYLDYVPNAGHGLNLSALPSLFGFFKASLQEKPLPTFDWQLNEDGSITVREDSGAQLKLWQAASDGKDFREAQWTASPIQAAIPTTIAPDTPKTGYLAYFIQAIFPGEAGFLPYTLSSQITVLNAD